MNISRKYRCVKNNLPSKIVSPNCEELSLLPQYYKGTFESWLLTIVAQLASHCGCLAKKLSKN